MKYFELRFLDRSDVVVSLQGYIGPDDLAALSEAEKLSATHTIEVWEGGRKVARVKKGNIALACTDRLAG